MATAAGGSDHTYRDHIDTSRRIRRSEPAHRSTAIRPTEPARRSTAARRFAAARLGERYPLALIALGVLLYSTGPIMLQSSALSGPAFSFWRLWIGAVFLSALALVRSWRGGRLELPSSAGLRWAARAGLAFGVHQLMFMTAVKLTSVVDVALMNALAPIATALGAWWLFRERPGGRFFAWSALAIGGGMFLAVVASGGPTGDPLGMALAVGNVAFFAVFFLASKAGRDQIDVLPFLAVVMTVAALLVSAYVAVTGVDVGSATSTDLLLAGAVALGPGAVGHFVMTWPLRWVPANIPPVMRLAQPALAGVMAWAILGEPLSLVHLFGGLVVVTGAAGAITSRAGRELQRQARESAPPTPGLSPSVAAPASS